MRIAHHPTRTPSNCQHVLHEARDIGNRYIPTYVKPMHNSLLAATDDPDADE